MKLLLIRTGGLANQYFQDLAGIQISSLLQRDLHVIDIGLKSGLAVNQSNEYFIYGKTHSRSRAPYLKPINSLLHAIASNKSARYFLNSIGMIISNETNDDLAWAKIRRNTWFISGNFQNDFFFRQLTEESRTPKNLENIISEVSAMKSKLDVVIHFRFGDYALLQNPQGILPASYYVDALRVLNVARGSEIFVVSDEPKKALGALGAVGLSNEYKFTSISSAPMVDLAVMINARNLICANSSFSLMAALLNGKEGIVTVPCPFYRDAKFELKAFDQKWKTIEILF